MQVDLIKRIRRVLNINPQSKSTLVKRQDLLRYAKKIYEQNMQMKDILEPRLTNQFKQSERKFEEMNITLMAYESELKNEKQRNELLQKTICYYKQYLKSNQETIRMHQQRIKEIDSMNIDDQNKKMQLANFQNMICGFSQDTFNGEGQHAMLQLMKQFLALSKQPEREEGSQHQ